MPGDRPRDVATIQTEVNRQSLVEIGKRLTELEQKFVSLEENTSDLRYLSASSLETAKRVQGIVKGLVDREKRREAKNEPD